MRVLLSTIGSRGDVQPLVALASELTALGQEVRLCVPPDFRDWIDRLGFPVTPIGPELRQMTASSSPAAAGPPSPTSAAAGGRHSRHAVRDHHRGCSGLRHHRGCDRPATRRPSVAERMGIPYVFAAYCPAVLPSPLHAPPPLPPIPGQAPAPASPTTATLGPRCRTLQ